MMVDRDWELESQRVRESLPAGVRGRGRVLNRRVETAPGEEWCGVFIASNDPTGMEISTDLEIRSGDSVFLEFPSTEKEKPDVIQGRVEWVRKNAQPILGRYSARIGLGAEKERGRVGGDR